MSSAAAQIPVTPSDRPTRGDRTFRTLCTAAALVSLVIVVATITFMLNESRPALRSSGIVSFFTDSIWEPTVGQFGVFGVLLGTIIIAAIAMFVAIPSAVVMAIFINEYAPKGVARWLTTAVDLLAALPSLIFGIWGVNALQGQLIPIARWLSTHLIAVPVFRLTDDSVLLVKSSFIAGVVVGLMVLPIVCSISREVMGRVPRELCEAALALGGTRWGMIKSVVLPFGRSGVTSSFLLGFGRALGETIAVFYVIQLSIKVNWNVLEAGGGSIASLIVIKFPEATPLERSGLVSAGLALLVLTFSIGLLSRSIANRKVAR